MIFGVLNACTRVLPIAGAGISMFTTPTMRIPIGASDDTATIAERLQFTVAQGPCIDAHHTGQRVWWPPNPSSPSGGRSSTTD